MIDAGHHCGGRATPFPSSRARPDTAVSPFDPFPIPLGGGARLAHAVYAHESAPVALPEAAEKKPSQAAAVKAARTSATFSVSTTTATRSPASSSVPGSGMDIGSVARPWA